MVNDINLLWWLYGMQNFTRWWYPILIYSISSLLSGERLHFAMKRSTIFHGKIHYFDWAIFNSFLYVHQAG